MKLKKTTKKINGIKKDFGISLNNIIVRNMDIDDTDLDGEKVMMNLDKGEYFIMNEVGSRIWELSEKEITVDEVIKTLLSEYEIDHKTCSDTVVEFLSQLNKADLVEIK